NGWLCIQANKCRGTDEKYQDPGSGVPRVINPSGNDGGTLRRVENAARVGRPVAKRVLVSWKALATCADGEICKIRILSAISPCGMVCTELPSVLSCAF